MRRGELVLLLAVVALGVALWLTRGQVLEERMARFNTEAAADSSRTVDSVSRAQERLAFQEREIRLEGDLRRVLVGAREQTQALIRLRVQLDSVANAVTTGTVTVGADSSIRQLAAQLDTAGYHVKVEAAVPAPPATAAVRWTVSRDPVAIVAALNRDAEGRIALRSVAGEHATTRIDSVRVEISRELGRTQKVAGAGLLLLAGYVVGRLTH